MRKGGKGKRRVAQAGKGKPVFPGECLFAIGGTVTLVVDRGGTVDDHVAVHKNRGAPREKGVDETIELLNVSRHEADEEQSN